MSSDFNPNRDPDINIPIWVRLVELRATLWNESSINKIASCIGVSLTTDYRTLQRENINGPRIQVIVNAATKPRESLTIRLHTGEFYDLKMEYECLPKYCTKCRSFSHLENRCMGPKDTIRQPPRQGTTGMKKKPNDQRNNGPIPQHDLNRKPAKQPKGKPHWKPTVNTIGAEKGQHPDSELVGTLLAYALPNRFDPIGDEVEANEELDKQNGQCGKPKKQKNNICPSSSIDNNIEKKVADAVADGTLHVNAAKRGSERGRSRGRKQGATNSSNVTSPAPNGANLQNAIVVQATDQTNKPSVGQAMATNRGRRAPLERGLNQHHDPYG
ncbi:uncharacterized protein LOC121749389 [Salvia splendens]|uniref:uncharacterized protein LOC121749389 n=1 Tax=Salvia splendens TaxID=180675 RepID=UPI001C258F36|nr:uncharacterized protein LOC121749389 [Salvia splendens]